MGTEGRDSLDEIEAALPEERPTQARIRRIEQSVAPTSYPPPSTDTLIRGIRAWLKANAWILALLGVGSTTGMVTPWRDWLGLATKADIAATVKQCADGQRTQGETLTRDIAKARRSASEAAARVEELESQLVAQKVLLESYAKKRRR